MEAAATPTMSAPGGTGRGNPKENAQRTWQEPAGGKKAPGRGPQEGGGRPALDGAPAIGRPVEQIEGGGARVLPSTAFPDWSRYYIGLATRAHLP
jgi:hypothetical protein